MIYLDNAATTEPSGTALLAYDEYYWSPGNASSQYVIGIANAQLIEDARAKIAHCINAEPEQIFFTSGGTESNNWAVFMARDLPWIVSKIEHPSMLNAINVHLEERHLNLGVDRFGFVDINQFEQLMSGHDYYCASVMLANNETGAIQPIKKLVEIFRKSGHDLLFHTDATQAMGHMPIDVKDLGVDMLSASGHKFGAFPGVGFLYIKNPDDVAMPFLGGGHQEGGLRGGTYNVAGIVGMADSLIESQIKMSNSKCGELRQRLISLLEERLGKIGFNTWVHNSLPHIFNFSIEGVRSEELVSYLDANEIYVSSGSACTSGDGKPSHVLLAMGRTEEEANSAIRVSMSYNTTWKDLETFVDKLAEGVDLLRR